MFGCIAASPIGYAARVGGGGDPLMKIYMRGVHFARYAELLIFVEDDADVDTYVCHGFRVFGVLVQARHPWPLRVPYLALLRLVSKGRQGPF